MLALHRLLAFAAAGALACASQLDTERALADAAALESESSSVSQASELETSTIEVSGVVRHADGRAAQGASVRLYLLRAEADPGGRFRIEVPWRSPFVRSVEQGSQVPLCAGLPGFQPALIQDFGRRVAAWEDIDDVELVLPGPALSISGRIVGADSTWEVELRDGTEIVPHTMPILFAEHLSSARSPTQVSPVRVAADGTFTIDGLLPRDYVIEAWLPWEAPVMVRSKPVAAGTEDLVLRVPPGAREVLRGRVVDLRGQPLAGLSLTVTLDIRVSIQGHHHSIQQPETTTDEDGRFGFLVPTAFSRLAITGRDVVPEHVSVEELVHLDDLVLQVARRARFVFEAAPGRDPLPDALEVLDGDGARLDIDVDEEGDVRWSGKRYALKGSSSPTLAVSEAARTVVVLHGDRALDRLPVELTPGPTVAVVAQPGREVYHLFGTSLAAVGDLDGDGCSDLAVGDPGVTPPGGKPWIGRVVVVSTRSGEVLLKAQGDTEVGRLGHGLTAPGDLDGDGRPDLVALGSRALRAIGAHGGPLWTLPLEPQSEAAVENEAWRWNGTETPSLCTVADLDDDGVSDLLLGLPSDDTQAQNAGSVAWISGASGKVFRRRLGTQPHERFGWCVAQVGDLDGDGSAELAVGAGGSQDLPARVDVLTSSGDRLRSHENPGAKWLRCIAACGVGDLDQDGHEDLAISWGRHETVAYSGAKGQSLRRWSHAPRLGETHVYGASLLGLSDVDADGANELFVALPQSLVRSGPCVWVLSGDEDRALLSIESNLLEGDFDSLVACFGEERWIDDSQPGIALALLGDVDLDGASEVAVGASSPRCGDCVGTVGIWNPRSGKRLRLFTACDVR